MKKRISITYKILLALTAFVGILLQCGIGTAQFSLSSFRMFTTLSNLAVGVFFILDAAVLLRHGCPSQKLRNILAYAKFLVTMAILLTGLVAHFMLRGMFAHAAPMEKAGLTLLHYVSPIGTLLDWILFDEKGHTTWKMPLVAAVFPLLYAGISMIAAQFLQGRDKYPYPFLDVDQLGAGMVLMNIVLLAIAFLVVGYVGVWLDHRWKQHSRVK